MDAALEDHPKIVAFPPLLWLIGAIVSILVHFFVFSIRILPEPFALILGIVCLLAGPSLALLALFTMRAAGTHANPAKPALLIVCILFSSFFCICVVFLPTCVLLLSFMNTQL